MTSVDSAKLATAAQDLVAWILDQALDGLGPLPSASDLADDYQAPVLCERRRTGAAIAEIYGHDSKNDQVRTAILLCMVGTAMEDVVKQAGVTLGGKVAIEGLKKIPGTLLSEINKRRSGGHLMGQPAT